MGSKISQLTEVTEPSSGNDQLEIIINSETAPLNRRIKFLNLLKRIFLGDGTQLTITTIADGEFLKRSGTNITSGVPSGSTDAEAVQDIVGAMIVDSATIDATYNDGAGTESLSVVDASIDAAKLAAASVNAQTGTSYTLVAGDNNKVVTLSNAAAITLTVPSGLGAGFSCLLVQLGAGQVTLSPSSTTINNRQSHTKIAGQYGVVSLSAYVANTFVLGGDTAA